MTATVTVAAAADDGYAMPLGVMIRSIAEKLPDGSEVSFFVVDGGISRKRKDLLRRTVDGFAVTLDFLRPLPALTNGLALTPHVTSASYYRLMVPELLPAGLHPVLYLDCDIVVRTSVLPLMSVDLAGKAIGAVRDAGTPFLASGNCMGDLDALGFSPGATHFNAGVLLLDLDACREIDMTRRSFAYAHAARFRITEADQEVLNAVLWEHIHQLDDRWNQQTEHFDYDDRLPFPLLGCSPEELLRDPYVVHYSAPSRPWLHGNTHPFRSDFLSIVPRTGWSTWTPRVPSRSQDLRTWTGQQMTRLARRVLPRGIRRWLRQGRTSPAAVRRP